VLELKNGQLMQERKEIRARVDLYLQIQKLRVAEGNRQGAFLRGVDAEGEVVKPTKIHSPIYRHLVEMEGKVDASVRKWVKTRRRLFPILDELTRIKGIGEMFAAYLVCTIDIDRCPTVSSLWRYAGLAVIDGKAERPKKGEKLHYNKRLKVACWKIASSFIKCRSPYSDIYYDAKEYYQRNRHDWTPMHCHLAAQRKMMKVSLQHLWERWRKLEGLPTPEPYVFAHLNHVDRYLPKDFGWRE